VPSAFNRTLAGGAAVFTGLDSPINKIIGAGMAGLPEHRDLALLEADFFAQKAAVRLEVSTLADPAFVQMLTARGYVLSGFENVLGHPLRAGHARPELPGEVTIEEPARPQVWRNVLLDGFAVPDTDVALGPGDPFVRDVLERLFEDMAGARGFTRYLALVNGEVAAGGSMRTFGGIAQLSGAATLPRFRRRGLQTALLRVRLADAASAGCDIAVVTTEPGSKSQRNAQHAGFALLYSRAVLTKQPPSSSA
jgi:GNAT superfamily N-acetyltransferase